MGTGGSPSGLPTASPRPSAAPTAAPTAANEHFLLTGTVTKGPICPVEQNPPDPACAPQPVAGATIVVTDATGRSVASVVSAADGSFSVALSPGAYRLTPQRVAGLLGTAPPVSVVVPLTGPPPPVEIRYDTGIR